ncbi:glycoside hydrolase family 3 N-terminal domain-containing protein [Nemorincola caseinilytica]|uniref:beta-N-acetylhexosaminidase n=1 Tax=Nemorincola caseinilytica TaxID=2054315 RepID=A0ABP8N857_9BACT
MAGVVAAQPVYRGKPRRIENAEKENWVNDVYERLTLEERIGQLFMVSAYSGGKNYNEDKVTELLANHQVGGLIFMQGGPARQALLTNKYQGMANVPLLIGMDAEWGVGMRLDSVKPMPRQMMLGATRDTGIVSRMAAAIAKQFKRLGMHINFAPDVDVNNNPANPVINSRSFGEEKTQVARMGRAYVRGLQKNGVMACAKHFPGHGNTSTDSHADLPLISRSVSQLDSVELFPFRQVIAEKVKSIMVAHLEVPSIEGTPHLPTTLSYATITGLLKNRLHYDGLVITDALNMKGLTNYFEPGEADLRAFAAGNDILLFPQDVPAAIARIKGAIDSGTIPMDRLEESVKKILGAKYDAGLSSWKKIETRNIVADLNETTDSIRARTARAAITLVKDDNQVLKKLNETMRIGYVGINASTSTPLYEALEDRFDNVKAHWLPKGSGADRAQEILEELSQYSTVIVAVHSMNFTPGGNYGIGDEGIAFLQQAACMRNVMIVLMGNAYATQYFCGAGSVLVGYEDDTLTQLTMAKVLLKKLKPKGKLPVTACADGQSVCPSPFALKVKLKEPSAVLRPAFPGEAGVVEQASLDKLDMFMARCIAQGVFPGCRVLAARNGNVFYDKAFGYLDYEKHKKVDANTMYDVASCTKVLSTTLAVMRLYEQGKLDLNSTIADHLPQARGTNKANIKIKDLLLHQAGLKGWIPFYKDVVDKSGKIKPDHYRSTKQPGYSVQVCNTVFLRDDYVDTMWQQIYDSKLDNKGKMVYSDLDFYFLAAIIKEITGKPIDRYAEDEFYKPLRLKNIMYNPLRYMNATNIAPTEIETGFRPGVLCGYVHDPGAAMLGGVGGHAGLFATANDVAVIFQMLMNKGVYAGKTYFRASTVDKFTAYGSKLSHRGLGFDKALPEADNGGGAGDRWSALTFGHQGFTGTCVWADPASGVVFVFLSNRVHPSSSNTKINKLSVRTVAQDYIYEALGIPINTARPEVYKVQVNTGE